jgi:hypothetical protein
MLIDCSATWRRELEGEWVELPDYVVFRGGIWKYAHTENDIRYYRATGFNTYILNSDEGMTFEQTACQKRCSSGISTLAPNRFSTAS